MALGQPNFHPVIAGECLCGGSHDPEREVALRELGKYEETKTRGWRGMPFAELDGQTWTLDIASKLLGIPVGVLRVVVKEVGAKPVGTLRMRETRGSGRQPLGYRASDLIAISEGLIGIREKINPPGKLDGI